MQWFRNLGIGNKLKLLVAIFLAFMATIGYGGYYAGSTMTYKADLMYNACLLPVEWLNTVRANTMAIEADVLQLITAPSDQVLQKQLIEDIEKNVWKAAS